MRNAVLVILLIAALATLVRAAEPLPAAKLFARENLIAWCIVPFDSKRRTPTKRAAMLQELGFTKFAYDWRAEHVASFDDEIKAMRAARIDIVGWWFPPALNADAQAILAALKRNDLTTQLWVAMDEPAPVGRDDSQRVAAAVEQLRPVVAAAAAQSCSVGLYNHGGWFGEPENQLAIIAALDAPNVGMVYNLHHGHEHLDRLAKLLPKMAPHLYAINLNGMDRDGDRGGRKILPVGQGELDLELLRIIHQSGYRGPIGIIGHTQDDAELRLKDNLDGLDWLVGQLEGQRARPRPTPRTPIQEPFHRAATSYSRRKQPFS
jgi:sugar phosphate isomerase/epimerase